MTEDKTSPELSIQFRPSKGTKNATVRIQPSGEIVIVNEDGTEVAPEFMVRAVHYGRSKGPKIQTRHKLANNIVTVGGLKELVQYDSIYVIDTNTKKIGQNRVSVACFICCRIFPEGKKFRVASENKLHFYEFLNAGGNPELLSILKLAKDVSHSKDSQPPHKIAIVTDTALGSHDSINSQTTPIYGPHCLPKGFALLYASTDTGHEVLNRLIRACDRAANKHFRYLKQGTIMQSDYSDLLEDSSVKFRYGFYDDVKIVDPVVDGIRIGEGTKLMLYRKKIS